MAAKIIYERFLWFHRQVTSHQYPNTRTLAQKFEISAKTAQRDIDFLRDRLHAPPVNNPQKRGYAYEDGSYDLPGVWINADELAALLIASRPASTIPDRGLKSSFKTFLSQILCSRTLNTPFSFEEPGEKISVKNIEIRLPGGGVVAGGIAAGGASGN